LRGPKQANPQPHEDRRRQSFRSRWARRRFGFRSRRRRSRCSCSCTALYAVATTDSAPRREPACHAYEPCFPQCWPLSRGDRVAVGHHFTGSGLANRETGLRLKALPKPRSVFVRILFILLRYMDAPRPSMMIKSASTRNETKISALNRPRAIACLGWEANVTLPNAFNLVVVIPQMGGAEIWSRANRVGRFGFREW
jgi:hypothetical protein